MADVTEIQASQSVKLAGSDPATGIESFWAQISSTGSQQIAGEGVAGTPAGGVLSIQGVAGGTAVPVSGNLGRTWTLSSGTDSILAVQSGTWTVQPGNTANTTAWFVKDNSLGTVAAGTAGTQSSLAGGVFNTALPTLTNGQQSAIQLDSSGRLIISPATQTVTGTVAVSNFPSTVDTNYGTVGANTLRTASQIGNATGAALFGAGTTTAQVLRVVLPTDQTAIPATQSGTWTVQPGNTANTTPWLTTDTADGPVTPGTVATKSQLMGGQFNTALPTLTNTQQSAIQLDSSGRLIIAPLTSSSTTTAAEDHNYGTIGANSLRTASQIGNATGSADFAAGNASAQTLRVVIATDQSALTVTQTTPANLTSLAYGKVQTASPGPFSLGTNNPLNLDSNGFLRVLASQGTVPWSSQDAADGPVTPGSVATKSMLMGGQFNTALPTLTNTQQSALQLDSSGRLLVSASIALSNDTNYGTVGANTLRTASQIGNATGAALFGAGTTTAQVLRVVLPTDQTAIPATQSGTWTVQPGNTANTTPWLTTDTADGPVTPGTVATKSQLMGGQFNTALPTLTNTQQSAIQLDSSGRLIIAPLTSSSTTTAAEDHNYGTVGANTLRTASQVGNATGSADFNFGTVGAQTLRVAAQIGNATGTADFAAGNSSAQTLRVVIASNQVAIPVSQSGTWTVQPGNTQNTTAWLTQDAANGPVTPGTVAAKSELIGGQFNSTLPTLTTGQQSAVQVDSSGRLLVSGITADVAPATINITARDTASTTTVVANGQNFITGAATANSTAAFTFSSEDTIVVQVTGTWTGTLQVELSMDGGTTWSPHPVQQDGTSYTLNAFTANFTGIANVAAYTNFRLRATTAWTGTATVKVIESVNPASMYIANAVKITDSGGDNIAITPNNDLQVADIINVNGQYRAQSITTSAAEALGAGTILANRKVISITPTNGTVYWGFNNSVTTSNGTPIFKNTPAVFAFGANVHIYLICASGTVDCRIAEGS